MELRVDGARLRADLASLSEIGRRPSGGISRTGFSAEDARARQWYKDRCDAAGLLLRTDGLGNMFTQAVGSDQDVPAVWTGSHIDTVPDGGPLDGALGTVAALECVRRIAEAGVALARPVSAVVFSDEEGNYGHLLGSYGIAHGYTGDELAALTGRDGDHLVDALATWTWSTGSPTGTRLPAGAMHSFVELHIEQGPHLEAAGTDIGVVTSIVGLSGGIVEFTGQADHAGTTPMTMRRDALRAAADFLSRLPALAASVSPTAVVTCGHIKVEPGGANVVPRLARVTLDFRDPDRDRLVELAGGIEDAARAAAAAHSVSLDWRPDGLVDPVPLDESVRAAVRESAEGLGLSWMDMPSGAGHDSQNVAHLAPTGMIFVPSRDGRSHSPAEYTDPAAVERGANVLLATVLRLAGA
jgi:N-carbamoyl-L-amino-acid hydrolase